MKNMPVVSDITPDEVSVLRQAIEALEESHKHLGTGDYFVSGYGGDKLRTLLLKLNSLETKMNECIYD